MAPPCWPDLLATSLPSEIGGLTPARAVLPRSRRTSLGLFGTPSEHHDFLTGHPGGCRRIRPEPRMKAMSPEAMGTSRRAVGSGSDLRRRAGRILRALKRSRADAHIELDFRSPFELLVATILSAQCTDARVNRVTPDLFRAYPDAAALAE